MRAALLAFLPIRLDRRFHMFVRYSPAFLPELREERVELLKQKAYEARYAIHILLPASKTLLSLRSGQAKSSRSPENDSFEILTTALLKGLALDPITLKSYDWGLCLWAPSSFLLNL